MIVLSCFILPPLFPLKAFKLSMTAKHCLQQSNVFSIAHEQNIVCDHWIGNECFLAVLVIIAPRPIETSVKINLWSHCTVAPHFRDGRGAASLKKSRPNHQACLRSPIRNGFRAAYPEYSKHPHIRTHDFGGQADWVLIYRVLNDKSVSNVLKMFLNFYLVMLPKTCC